MANKKNKSSKGRKSARGKKGRKLDTAEDIYADQIAHARAMMEAEKAEEARSAKSGASRRGGEDSPAEKAAAKTAEQAQVEEVEKASKAEPEEVEEAVVADAVKEAKKAKKAEKAANKETPEQDEGFEAVDPLEYGTQWLEGVFERMNFDIEVGAKIEDDGIYFNATGPDADYLLGIGTSAPKSIEAIQTLLGAALANRDEKRDVYLDVGGWRDQRSERFESVARELGEVAKKLGKSVTIAGFNSYERSVVHKALEDDSSVTTDSQGKGIFRKLSVKPS